MDFKDSAEDAALRTELRAFLDTIAKPKIEDELGVLKLFEEVRDETAWLAEQRRWQKELYDAGWGCVTWPKEYGGRNATPNQALIFSQELGRYEIPPLEVFMIGLGMVGPTLLVHGTEEQRSRYIPRIIEGSEIWCQLWSEPNAGSDLASLETRAERQQSGDWVLNGQKVWTSLAQYCSWGMCLARTDPEVPKNKGLSVFIVDMTSPGVTVQPLKQITGRAHFNEVFLDEVRVPAGNVVGEVNDGWRVAQTMLMNERYAVGSLLGGGFAEPVIALAKALARDGATVIESPLVRQDLADAVIRSKLVTLTGYRTLTTLSKGGIPGPEGSIMKLAATDLFSRAMAVAVRILGLRGVLWGAQAPSEGLWWHASSVATGQHIAGGTDDIMRNIIGERVLGLPREPQVDAGLSYRDAKARWARPVR